MDHMARPQADLLSAPAQDARDFVVVDDSGAFSYYATERALLADFEYMDEASCIIDRQGHYYRLELDPNRHLILGPALGPVEYHWLRQALADAQEIHAEEHRLRRLMSASPAALVSGIFETLELERESAAAPAPWTFDIGAVNVRRSTLHDVDRRLSEQVDLAEIRVTDPFGHVYRPVRYRKHWYLPASAGFIVYNEIPASRK